MIYPVKIMDAHGSVKKIIDYQQISKMYWQSFEREFSESVSSPDASTTQKICKVNCQRCQKEVAATRNNVKFCSLKCRSESYSEKLRAANITLPDGECIVCKSTFKKKTRAMICCSRECRVVRNRDKSRRSDARSKANRAKRKFEIHGGEAQVFQHSDQAASQVSEVGETHLVSQG
jgi:hypothetical protein